jgi:TRAP-type C4-dicarboxylate transport system permease small subunit
MSLLTTRLPGLWRKASSALAELLMGTMAAFTVVWGKGLVETTWHNTIAEFPSLSVGVTYLPIPIGGAITLLFVVERLTIGRPPPGWADRDAAAEFE